MDGLLRDAEHHRSSQVHLLVDSMEATARQKHSARGFMSTLGSKHEYNVVSTRREADKARLYSIAK